MLYNKVDFDAIIETYRDKEHDLEMLVEYYEKFGTKDQVERVTHELRYVNDFLLDLIVLKSIYEVAPNSPYRKVD